MEITKKLSCNQSFACPTRGKKPSKLYMIVDVETATLPIINEFDISDEIRKKIAIAKPLVYDIGWTITSSTGRIYSSWNFLIQETFFVPSVFNTAYYKDKRPKYIELLEKGEILTTTWSDMVKVFRQDLERADIVTAFNAMFDFKKAINFTDRYIDALYSSNYNDYEGRQRQSIKNMIKNRGKSEPNPEFDKDNFNFKNKDYEMSDIWGLACNVLINNDTYKREAIKKGALTQSGLYYSTTAESVTQYLLRDDSFKESHTALDDVEIEKEILLKIIKKIGTDIPIGLNYFPFQELGETVDYCCTLKKNGTPLFTKEELVNVLDILYNRSLFYDIASSFSTKLAIKAQQLLDFIETHYCEEVEYKDKLYFYWTRYVDMVKTISRLRNERSNLKPDGKAYKAKTDSIERAENELAAFLEVIEMDGFKILNDRVVTKRLFDLQTKYNELLNEQNYKALEIFKDYLAENGYTIEKHQIKENKNK